MSEVNKTAKEKSLPPIDISWLDLRVGQICDILYHHWDESCFIAMIDIGERITRLSVMKLCRYYKTRHLWHKNCVVLCNINPINKGGVTATARVLVAAKPRKRELLRVPMSSQPGELIQIEGYSRANLYDPVYALHRFDTPKKMPKRKIFSAVFPDLKVNADRIATYRDIPFYVEGPHDKGYIKSKTITNGHIR